MINEKLRDEIIRKHGLGDSRLEYQLNEAINEYARRSAEQNAGAQEKCGYENPPAGDAPVAPAPSDTPTPECDAIEALTNSRDYKPWRELARKLERERNEAKALAERSVRRMVEMAEPGFIGAFGARDAAIERAEQAEAALNAENENLRALLRECQDRLIALVRHKPMRDLDEFIERIKAAIDDARIQP